MMLYLLVTFFAILSSILSIEFTKDHNQIINKTWKLKSDIPIKSSLIQLIFAIKQQNINLLNKKLLQVSSTLNKDYGKLLTLEEINKLTQPKDIDINNIVKYLLSHDINEHDIHISSGFLKVTVDLNKAEELLNTNYHIYEHEITKQTILRCQSYNLPDHIATSIDFVAPTIEFPASFHVRIEDTDIKYPKTEKTVGDSHENTPDSLRSLYGVNDVQGGKSDARQAVTAFLHQYYKESDLQLFYQTYYPTLYGTHISKVVGINEDFAGVEASLDVEYMTTLGSGVPTEFWSFSGSQYNNTENEPFLECLYTLGSTLNPPLVFSTSYGEDEVSVSYNYAVRMNEEFQKQALRGITFLFASGDSGVGSCFGACTTYTPQFPSDSPFVTAVGATTGANPETAASLSSGGFSNRWAQPSWQAQAVSTYLTTAAAADILPASNLYNASGRGFPDVSAQGTSFVVINNGQTYPAVAGTSCSSPTFGGIVALLNDARIAIGKAPLGFLNPLIYEHPEIFTDITSGNNPGCGTKGFEAIAGWDPVTGYGTPNYAKMLDLVLSLP